VEVMDKLTATTAHLYVLRLVIQI
ncbi:unnamed protein product, partial [Allacma fusca]